jgi:hypothetical protein
MPITPIDKLGILFTRAKAKIAKSMSNCYTNGNVFVTFSAYQQYRQVPPPEKGKNSGKNDGVRVY